jgi:DNA repair protein RadC
MKNLLPEERPREKMLNSGPRSLSDAELICLLIGSGTKDESAIELARKILLLTDNRLPELGKLRLTELTSIKGIGTARAVIIASALELGRRRRAAEVRIKEKISSSKDAYEYLLPQLEDLQHEEFWIICLSRSNEVIKYKRISEGGMHATVVDPKRVFYEALQERAAALILAHNHPSGNLQPSPEDFRITKRLLDSGRILDCPVLDHIIVTSRGYYSFADENQLEQT